MHVFCAQDSGLTYLLFISNFRCLICNTFPNDHQINFSRFRFYSSLFSFVKSSQFSTLFDILSFVWSRFYTLTFICYILIPIFGVCHHGIGEFLITRLWFTALSHRLQVLSIKSQIIKLTHIFYVYFVISSTIFAGSKSAGSNLSFWNSDIMS